MVLPTALGTHWAVNYPRTEYSQLFRTCLIMGYMVRIFPEIFPRVELILW